LTLTSLKSRITDDPAVALRTLAPYRDRRLVPA
jgi:hypothetical protein